jgi:hypothetical protein
MKTFLKHRVLCAFLIIIIITAVLLSINIPSANNVKTLASQNAFSKLPEPYLFELGEVESVNKLVYKTDIVIIGTIIKKGDQVYSQNNYLPGSAQAALKNKISKDGKDPFMMTFNSYFITVDEYLKGERPAREIMLVQPIIGEDYEPQFKQNDRLVFFLRENIAVGVANAFIAFHPQASYIYINQGDLVNPVYKKNEFAALSNISLSELKERIYQAVK